MVGCDNDVLMFEQGNNPIVIHIFLNNVILWYSYQCNSFLFFRESCLIASVRNFPRRVMWNFCVVDPHARVSLA